MINKLDNSPCGLEKIVANIPDKDRCGDLDTLIKLLSETIGVDSKMIRDSLNKVLKGKKWKNNSFKTNGEWYIYGTGENKNGHPTIILRRTEIKPIYDIHIFLYASNYSGSMEDEEINVVVSGIGKGEFDRCANGNYVAHEVRSRTKRVVEQK